MSSSASITITGGRSACILSTRRDLGQGSKKLIWKFENGICHEEGGVLHAINVFFDFLAQKLSIIVTIKNWMEISDIKSGVGGGWGWGVRCLMAIAI